MKDIFHAYFPPDEAEFSRLWQTAWIVPDTNVLLDLYRYSEPTRNGLLKVFEYLSDRLWMPNHVGKEFLVRRLDVIQTIQQAYDKTIDAVESAPDKFLGQLREYGQHPTIDLDDIERTFREVSAAQADKIRTRKASHAEDFPYTRSSDEILLTLRRLFDGRTGADFTSKDRAALIEEAKDRYSRKVPPGYMDSQKKDGNEYGDYMIWRQVVRWAADQEVHDVILITGDSKEDWWWKHRGETIGPRVELVEEFKRETQGGRIHIYAPKQFMQYAEKYFGELTQSPEVLTEVEEVSASRQMVEDFPGHLRWMRSAQFGDAHGSWESEFEARSIAAAIARHDIPREAGRERERSFQVLMDRREYLTRQIRRARNRLQHQSNELMSGDVIPEEVLQIGKDLRHLEAELERLDDSMDLLLQRALHSDRQTPEWITRSWLERGDSSEPDK